MVSLSDFVSWKLNADIGSCNALQMPVRPYKDQRRYDCLQDVDFLCRLSCGLGLGGCVDEGHDCGPRCESEGNLLEVDRKRLWLKPDGEQFSRLQSRQFNFVKKLHVRPHLSRSMRIFSWDFARNPTRLMLRIRGGRGLMPGSAKQYCSKRPLCRRKDNVFLLPLPIDRAALARYFDQPSRAVCCVEMD